MAQTTHFAGLLGREERPVAEGSIAKGIVARLTRWRLYRRTLTELRGLSRRELADLGLHRSMLKRVAWQAAYDTEF